MANPASIQNQECFSQSSQSGAVELYACLSDIVKLLLIVELFEFSSGLIPSASVPVRVDSEPDDLDVFTAEVKSVVDFSRFSSRIDTLELSIRLSLSVVEISVVSVNSMKLLGDVGVVSKTDTGVMADVRTAVDSVANVVTGVLIDLVTSLVIDVDNDSVTDVVVDVVTGTITDEVIDVVTDSISGVVTDVVVDVVIGAVTDAVTGVIIGGATVEVIDSVSGVVTSVVVDVVTGAITDVVTSLVVVRVN